MSLCVCSVCYCVLWVCIYDTVCCLCIYIYVTVSCMYVCVYTCVLYVYISVLCVCIYMSLCVVCAGHGVVDLGGHAGESSSPAHSGQCCGHSVSLSPGSRPQGVRGTGAVCNVGLGAVCNVGLAVVNQRMHYTLWRGARRN